MVTQTLESSAIKALAQILAPAMDEVYAERYGRKDFGAKHDATGTPQASGYSHGPGGNLSYPGVDPAVFSPMVGNTGILSMLPAIPALDMNPLFQVLTGVQGATGSEKTEVCGNAPQAGLMKSCILTSQFGRYERATRELEVNRMGFVNDRADPMDLRLVNSPLYNSGHPFFQGPGNPANPADVLRNEWSRKMMELGVEFHRLLNLQLWRGNPANNAGSGAYREVTGFSVLVNTGHTDAITGTTCPSTDSDLKNFNYLRIDSGSNGTELVKALSYLYMTRRRLAETSGMGNVRWVFAMRPETWFELSQVYPCSYLTYMCQVSGNQQVQINGSDQIRFRDEMRAGRYLLVNGDRIDVVVDDGIAFLDGNSSAGHFPAGCMSSDIYLIPLAVGPTAVTYLEYADYSNPSIRGLMEAIEPGAFKVEGAFLTWARRTNQCVVLQSKIEPRLIMRTPWLAGRLQNVVVCPLQVAPQPFPDDPYHLDGGVTGRSGPSYYDGTWKS